MRIMPIGSCVSDDSYEELSRFCYQLGKELATKSIELILCSPFKMSFDFELLQGVLSVPNQACRLQLFYPSSDALEKKWYTLLEKLPKGAFIQFTYGGFDVEDLNARKFAWLYCQLQALEKADVVLAVGGNEDGASNLFFKIAENQRKNIIPIVQFGGMAKSVFNQRKYQILDAIGEDIFNKLYRQENLEVIIQTVSNRIANEETFLAQNKLDFEPVFFISYARKRPSEADHIEMILRRRNFTVLRDEKEIDAGEDVVNAISENIAKSNIFIAVWCKEYACSPYCIDEMEEALKRKAEQKTKLWIVRVEDIRIVPKNARNLLYVDAFDRESIEGKIIGLVDKLK